MGQTEKYYRKYRKYKQQYLYYKQYLGGTAQAEQQARQARQARIDEKKREEEEAEAARLKEEEIKVERAEDKAAAMGANDPAAVLGELKKEADATDDEKKAIQDASNIDTTQLIQQEEVHQDQVAVKNVEGLMMQKKGIDMQINSKLQGVQFDETMGQAFTAQVKGDIETYKQDCQQLANEVKQGVEQVPGIVRGFARVIKTHERQDSGRYTLSERGDNIEKIVLKQVDRFAQGDAKEGKEIYENCKEEIHHEVGQLINNEQKLKTLDEIKAKEAKQNQNEDQQDTAATKGEEG
jgi:hypothetical protein